MNLSVQPHNMNQNVAFTSVKRNAFRLAALAVPVAALLTLSGCKSDRFEKQNDVPNDSVTNIENLSATRYNYDWDSTANGIKHLDAIQYNVGNNEKQLILDSLGNVDVEHTYKKDNNGKYIGFETIHHNSNGVGQMDAYRVKTDDINDSTRVTSLYDIDGDLISKDSVVHHKAGGSDNNITLGTSKLLK